MLERYTCWGLGFGLGARNGVMACVGSGGSDAGDQACESAVEPTQRKAALHFSLHFVSGLALPVFWEAL